MGGFSSWYTQNIRVVRVINKLTVDLISYASCMTTHVLTYKRLRNLNFKLIILRKTLINQLKLDQPNRKKLFLILEIRSMENVTINFRGTAVQVHGFLDFYLVYRFDKV